MIPWILLILLLLIYCVTLPALFERGGMNKSVGYIPIINLFFLIKMLKRPWYWFILLFAPGVNILMLIILNVELGIAFGQRLTPQQWKFGALPWYAIPELAFKNKDEKFVGPRSWEKKKKSTAREWGEAILFAVIAATVIRTFAFEAYTIPTPSMEGSMLVGDYLFVSKMSYGAKSPQTPMSVPFVHNRLPGGMTKSYTNWFSMPYFRLPGFGDVERFDPVVFNFPPGDTIIVDPYLSTFDYYQKSREYALQSAGSKEEYLKDPAKYDQMGRSYYAKKHGLSTRPLDKREHYIKRCMGLPGDNLSIVDGVVHIDGVAVEEPQKKQFNYGFSIGGSPYMSGKIMERLDLDDQHFAKYNNGQIVPGMVTLDDEQAAELRKLPTLDTLYRVDYSFQRSKNNSGESALNIFPNHPKAPFNNWDIHYFGPIHIPAKGETIPLNEDNLILYKRCITHFEGHTFEERDGKYFIDGVESTEYTFELDYYWMMGDNRHNSLDSRYWGFVPETHVVGKAVFTWFSKENDRDHGKNNKGIRWNRMFRFVD